MRITIRILFKTNASYDVIISFQYEYVILSAAAQSQQMQKHVLEEFSMKSNESGTCFHNNDAGVLYGLFAIVIVDHMVIWCTSKFVIAMKNDDNDNHDYDEQIPIIILFQRKVEFINMYARENM